MIKWRHSEVTGEDTASGNSASLLGNGRRLDGRWMDRGQMDCVGWMNGVRMDGGG